VSRAPLNILLAVIGNACAVTIHRKHQILANGLRWMNRSACFSWSSITNGARIKVPDLTAHSIIHAVVENQLAQNDEPVVRALVRLTKQGLSRHDAIHAIGSVVTTQIFDALQSKQPVQRDAYYAEIETLTADKWLRSNAG